MILFLFYVIVLPSIQNDFFWTTSFRDIEIGQVQIANNSDILLLGNIYGTWVKGCIKDIFLARFDSEGNFIFAKVYGGDERGESIGNGDYYHHWSIMTEVAGGSIYIFFITSGFGRTTPQPGILKLSSQGNIVWVKLENGFAHQSGMPDYAIMSINEVDDGIVVGGHSKIANWDSVFHKFLHDGTLVFQKTWDSPGNPWHTGITKGFNVPGEEKLVYVVDVFTSGASPILNNRETYVFKTNYDISAYDWRRVYATATTLDKKDVVFSYLFLVTSDGNLVLAGYTDTFGIQNVIFYKLDLSNGNVLFGKRVYVTDPSPAYITPYKVIELEEGYLLSGYADISIPNNPEFFFLVSKTDGSVLKSDFIWKRDFEMKDFVVVKNTSLGGGKEEIIAAYSSKEDDGSFYDSYLTRFQIHGYQCLGTVLQTNGSSCTDVSDQYCPFFIDDITIYSNTHTYDFLSDTHAFPVEDITAQFKVLDATNSFKKDKDFLCFQDYTHCYGISKINSSTCSSHGKCSSNDNCTCDPNYVSNDCSQFECFNKPWNDSTVCNYNNGSCTGPNNCTCHNGYYGDECKLWNCNKFLYNDTLHCFSHGICVSPEICICEENYNYTKFCDWKCGVSYSHTDDEVCNKNGKCSSFNNCSCDPGYTGEECEYWSCFGIYVNSQEDICNGHGNCVRKDTCHCSSGYSSSEIDGICDEWYCGEHFKNDTEACNGHGNCTGHYSCSCEDQYLGSLCETHGWWKCNGNFASETSIVCGGSTRGECLPTGLCECKPGYESEFNGGDCIKWKCGNISHDDISNPNLCTSGGSCIAPDQCDCTNGYVGSLCNEWKCGGEYYYDTLSTCSGQGICIAPNECNCTTTDSDFFSYVGSNCQLIIGKRLIRSTLNLLMIYFEINEEDLKEEFNLLLDRTKSFPCSKIITIDKKYHSELSNKNRLLFRNCTISNLNQFSTFSGTSQFLYFQINHLNSKNNEWDDIVQNLNNGNLNLKIGNKPIQVKIIPTERKSRINDESFTMKSFLKSSSVDDINNDNNLINNNYPAIETEVCKSRLEIGEGKCIKIYKCYKSEYENLNSYSYYLIGYSPSSESKKHLFTKFYFSSFSECSLGINIKEYKQFSAVSCSGSLKGDNFIMYKKCSSQMFDILFSSQILTYFFVSTSPLYILFLFLGFLLYCCGVNWFLFMWRRIFVRLGIIIYKKRKNVDSYSNTQQSEEKEEESTDDDDDDDDDSVISEYVKKNNEFSIKTVVENNNNINLPIVFTEEENDERKDNVILSNNKKDIINNQQQQQQQQQQQKEEEEEEEIINHSSSSSSSSSSLSYTNKIENNNNQNLLISSSSANNEQYLAEEFEEIKKKLKFSIIFEGKNSSKKNNNYCFCGCCGFCFICNLICCIITFGCCNIPCFYEILKSLVMVLFILIKEGFALWFSSSEFLDVSDIDNNNKDFIILIVVMKFNMYLIWGSIFTYLVILMFSIFVYVERFHNDPFMFCVAYGSLKEFVWYRIFKSLFLVWFICINIFCYFVKFAYLDEYEKESALRNPNFWLGIIFPEFLLIFSLLHVVGYNGVSSKAHLRRLKKLGIKGILKFPKIKIGFGKLGKDVDVILEDFFQLIFLIDKSSFGNNTNNGVVLINNAKKVKEKIIIYLSSSEEFGHLSWEMLDGLTGEEILYLKDFFFPDSELVEESYLSVFNHHRILSSKWWCSFLCFPVFCMLSKKMM